MKRMLKKLIMFIQVVGEVYNEPVQVCGELVSNRITKGI